MKIYYKPAGLTINQYINQIKAENNYNKVYAQERTMELLKMERESKKGNHFKNRGVTNLLTIYRPSGFFHM